MAKAQKVDRGEDNAKGWLASIEEMLEALEKDGSTPSEQDDARERIEESPLSVQVRDGWRQPGSGRDGSEGPEEYEILLSTGGPALRIIGRLSEYREPDSAELQIQDWGTPWTRYSAPQATLLAFARCFWFGE